MSGFLGALSFLNPWILGGFIILPGLYYLLRIMPPNPQHITLPSIRFLLDLNSQQHSPSRTPWWILLLRMFILALIITGLSAPVYNISADLPGNGKVRIIIDNGWASAQNWSDQMAKAGEILTQAEREGRAVTVMTTALPPGQETWAPAHTTQAAQARGILKTLTPYPWAEDYNRAADLIGDERYTNFWLSHGIKVPGQNAFARTLKEAGGYTRVILPTPENLPVILKWNDRVLRVDAPKSVPESVHYAVQALDENGRVIDQVETSTEDGLIVFNLIDKHTPPTRYKVVHKKSAGSVLLSDSSFGRKMVGLLGPDNADAMKPFIEARYYLNRALEPYAKTLSGGVKTLLEGGASIIIMPDSGALPEDSLKQLEEWVKNGGIFLRFAGPNLAASDDLESLSRLIPVDLRFGSRSMNGALTWDEPAHLQAFPATSPLAGIAVSDIQVNTQILAEPGQDLSKKTWASLEDGTPLITADTLGNGLLIFVHTSASPSWSDLALSGTYVEILKRITDLSGGSFRNLQQKAQGVLQPLLVLDGFGNIIKPDAHILPIDAADFKDTQIDHNRPPGIYGTASYSRALNLGDHIEDLESARLSGFGFSINSLDTSSELSFRPHFLLAAFGFLLFDWMVMMHLSGIFGQFRFQIWKRFNRGVSTILFMIFILWGISPTYAERFKTEDLKYADGLYLAYVRTGNTGVDDVSRQGLEHLVRVLNRRTSAEPIGVAGLDLESDTLVFFPLIYWPVVPSAKTLSPIAKRNIQSYLDHGGTILFDTRESSAPSSSFLVSSSHGRALQEMIGDLQIPVLQPIGEEHVLKKSFYLLDEFPGQYSGGTVWVEQKSLNGRDGVSSVIIGSHNWAGQWANAGSRSRQHELSLRFGVNVVMYALSGNYKADQVHLPYILERLGQ